MLVKDYFIADAIRFFKTLSNQCSMFLCDFFALQSYEIATPVYPNSSSWLAGTRKPTLSMPPVSKLKVFLVDPSSVRFAVDEISKLFHWAGDLSNQASTES